MIVTAADISTSAVQWKTVTRASDGTSAGDKSSRDGPRTRGGWRSKWRRGEEEEGGGWHGGEERRRVQTSRPLKGRCGWQPLTLVTMGFHQRLLMKADCQGTVREPKGRVGGEGRERRRREKGDGEKDRGEAKVIAALVGRRPRGPVMSGCSREEERCLWMLWW